MHEDPEADFAYLTQGVTLEVFQAVRDLEIPWVYFELRPSRTYPNGAVAGNLVGFIGTDGPQAGLELSEDECLASSNGTSTFEKGEDGVRLPGSLVTSEEPKNGGTLRLTIDRDLQFYVQQRMAETYRELGAEWTTAVVIRISDGHLMAVADYPSVDPNNVDGVPNTALGSLAFSWPYEPGSTMKAVTAASLLDAGVATQTSQIVVPGRLYLSDGDYIKDAWDHGDENYTLTGALVDSSNVAMSIFSDSLSADRRHDYLTAFGLNSSTEVDFTGESEGLVHPADEWDERTNYAVQFGQGLSTTSVQMASIYQALGNEGVRMPVTLVEGCEWPDGTITQAPSTEGTRVVSEQAADRHRRDAREDRHGRVGERETRRSPDTASRQRVARLKSPRTASTATRRSFRLRGSRRPMTRSTRLSSRRASRLACIPQAQLRLHSTMSWRTRSRRSG